MKNDVNLLTYFLSRTLFLGGGLSIIFQTSSTDTYISAILGTLIGIAIIYIISKLNNNTSLNNLLSNNRFLKIIYFIYLTTIIFLILIIISVFIYSYFLPFTPSLLSCIPLIFLASYLNNKSSKNISYVGLVLMILSLVTIITKTLLLTNEFDFSNLLPIFSKSPTNIFKSAFLYAILSTAPVFLMLGENIEFKKSLKYYLLACGMNIIVLLSITLNIGKMISIYSYPEYSVLRKIRFFNFIENIENIISMSWFFDIFITLSLASLKLKETINTKNSIYSFGIVTIIMVIINNYFTENFYNTMIVYKIFPYTLLGIITILINILLIKFIKNKKTDIF